MMGEVEHAEGADRSRAGRQCSGSRGARRTSRRGGYPGVVATYTLDGDFVFFDGPRVVGREAIRKWTTDDLATMPSTKRITLTVTGIRFLADDIAIAETSARFNEGEARENRGTSVFVRQNGRWLVAALRVYPAQRP